MQITYETNFEHWLAGQLFSIEQNKALTENRNKQYLRLLFYLVLLDAVIFFLKGADTSFWVYTWFIGIWLIFLLFQRSQRRRLVCRQLRLVYQPEFEKLTDKTTVWTVTSEHVSVKDVTTETIFSWNGVRKMTVCPDYLFILFGIEGNAWLPKQSFAEAEYQTICDSLIKTYQAYTADHGETAQVEHSDWTLNIQALLNAARPCSAKKIIFSVLWGIAFLVFGMVLLGMLVYTIVLFTTLCSDSSDAVDRITTILLTGWLIGSALLMAVGVGLGLFEKLPGTKSRK